MASGLAIAVTKGVLGKLGEIAVEQVLNEVSLLFYFRDDFKWLQKKFRLLSAALEDAGDQNVKKDLAKSWLEEVRDIAFDAQDIIDECAVQHLYRNSSKVSVPGCSQLIFKYNMGKRIKNLKERVKSLIQDGHELKLLHELPRLDQPSTSGTSELRGARFRRGSAMLEADPQAVGVKEKKEEIERLLEQPAIGVVAVVGMGGLGKSFLLQSVYNGNKQRYELSAWISVSQTCTVRTLQGDLVKQINLEIDGNISEVLIADLIHSHLVGRRCLIVLDDVWRSSVDGDIIQRLGLRTSQCKIVVTTRSRDVARDIRAHIYDMQHLSEEESWKLFRLFAFPASVENSPPHHLESMAHQIVEKCGGLHLAVKIVAASMSNSVVLADWEVKLGQLKNVQGAEDSTMQILKLSYDSLPFHLKSCFAYFSLFPEDTNFYFNRNTDLNRIHQDYLIYLWIDEGFVPKENDQWEIGLDCLHQLVNLCLVEVSTVNPCYTVHDLLHDLAISVSKENKCGFRLPLQETTCRRFLLGKKGITNDAVSESSLHLQQFLRTLSLFENPDITSIPQHLFDRLRLLRVLDFRGTNISAIPKSVGKLKLLRFLNLSQTKMTEVPACVRKLRCLQYIDVSGCTAILCLPEWIGDLTSLSHLDIRDCSSDLHSHMPKGISNLSRLSILRSEYIPLSTEENKFLNVKDVSNLINLQEMNFSLHDAGVLQNVEDDILERLVKMKILAVWNDIPAGEDGILPSYPEKMNVMKDLQELTLGCFSVPNWICGVVNLRVLVLHQCSDYFCLRNIPNLQELVLHNDQRCRELHRSLGRVGHFLSWLR